MQISTVFESLFQRGVTIEPQKATEDVVTRNHEIASMRERGIEPPVALQKAIRETLLSALSDQKNPDWWKKLRPEEILAAPELSAWKGDPSLDEEVNSALRNISGAAAEEVWNAVSGVVFNDEFEIADFTGKRSLEQQLHKLTQIAAKEIGAKFTTRQFDEPSGA